MNDDELVERLRTDPLATAADYYAHTFANHNKAIDFVTVELLCSAKSAKELRIGFADRSLGTRLPNHRLKGGQELRQQLIDCGLYRDNGREHLRGFVTFPLTDRQGHVTGIYGIRLDRKSDGDKELCVGSGIFNAPALTNGKPPVVVTIAEAVKLHSAGHTGVVAMVGVDELPPQSPPSDPDLIIEDQQVIFTRDDRRYRVRGLEKNASTCTLRVNLMASRDGLVHLDSLDLVKARSRASFVKATATELYVDEDIIKRDIGELLLRLETVQSERIAELKKPKAEVILSDEEQAEALELLRDPNLLERIVDDLDAVGIVGERTNKLAGYLAAVSRKLDTPLAIVIQSSSSAGKTSLMDAILSLVPDEDQLRLSNLSGQALYYFDTDDIRHKTLAISEDEGLSQAAYALKLLQSEGVLRHATVGKGDGGRMTAHQHTVEGPVQMMLTTTATELDEELMNRCLVLSVDETREQTKAIHRRQQMAQKAEGGQAAQRAERIRKLHQNAQRLLRTVAVYNPYADQLTFPSDKTRLRRDHAKYLALIRAVALLHQHQRPIHGDAINVTPGDIAIANSLAAEILGRSLDELSPQTRRFLSRLHGFVAERCRAAQVKQADFRFTRRDVREALGWTDFQVHTHLTRLAELEYVLPHRGTRGRRYVYELLYDGQGAAGKPFLMGLADPQALTTPSYSVPEAELAKL